MFNSKFLQTPKNWFLLTVCRVHFHPIFICHCQRFNLNNVKTTRLMVRPSDRILYKIHRHWVTDSYYANDGYYPWQTFFAYRYCQYSVSMHRSRGKWWDNLMKFIKWFELRLGILVQCTVDLNDNYNELR